MPVLKNARHEKYAQLLAKLHGKMTVTDAHEQAGYRRNDGNASTLSQHPDIQTRVNEIKGRAAARTALEVEDFIHMQDEFRQLAKKSGQYNAGISAVKEMSILAGKRIERAEIGAPGEFDALGDDELERLLIERLAQLGFALVPAISDGSITLNGTALKDRDR